MGTPVVKIASSKSYLQRALLLSALSKGSSVLHQVSWCKDSWSLKKIIEDLGVQVFEDKDQLKLHSRGLNFEKKRYHVGESGLAFRILAPVLALGNQEFILDGEGSLKKRPMQMIHQALEPLGVRVQSENGFLPFKIQGAIQSGNIDIDGSLSSQLLSGLLMALPLAQGDSLISVQNLKSIPYIDMTLDAMRQFGVGIEHQDYQIFKIKGNQTYIPTEYTIEGDWSGGAFFLVYGAVAGGVEVQNLNPKSLQADRAILDALEKCGANISLQDNSLIVSKNKLRAFEFDATHCPDIFPPLVCLASQCEGITRIQGVSRLKHKESDRATVLLQEFSKMGIDIRIEADTMYIKGGEARGCVIDSHNDHRIAMAGAIMNRFCSEEISIHNKDAVEKSYPHFFNDLCKL